MQMVNYNGTLCPSDQGLPFDNRGFKYGDALFDTLRRVSGKILFWEDHYFRMMAGLRMLRMDIPLAFTPDFLRAEIEKLPQYEAARVRITLFREAEGRYTPRRAKVGYLIESEALSSPRYASSDEDYRVGLFTDFYVQATALSNIKSTNRTLNVIAAVFASENAFDNCFLLNDSKQLVGAVNGNVFLRSGDKLITPSADQGCIKGIFRKNLLRFVTAKGLFQVEERAVSPFELVKAEAVFITNVISGMIPVSHYRTKVFDTQRVKDLFAQFRTVL